MRGLEGVRGEGKVSSMGRWWATLVVSTYRVAGGEAGDETLTHVGKVGLGWLAWKQGQG